MQTQQARLRRTGVLGVEICHSALVSSHLKSDRNQTLSFNLLFALRIYLSLQSGDVANAAAIRRCLFDMGRHRSDVGFRP